MLRVLLIMALAVPLLACQQSYTEAQIAALESVAGGALLVDVRSKAEFDGGHLDGALLIPHTQIVAGIEALDIQKDAPIVLYCRSGNRSGQAMVSLQRKGFTQVTNAGGYESLRSARDALSNGG